MAEKPNPSFEDIPPFPSLKRVRGDACPRRREDYVREKHVHIYSCSSINHKVSQKTLTLT